MGSPTDRYAEGITIDAEHPEGRPSLPSERQRFKGEEENDSPAPSDSTAPPPEEASSPPPPPAQASSPPPSSPPPSSSPPTTPVSSPPPPTDPSSPPPPPTAGSKSPPPSSSPPPPSGGGDPSLPSQPLSPPPPSATPSTPVPDGVNATTAPVTLSPPGSISGDPGIFNAPPSQSLPGAPGRPLPTPPQPRGTPSNKPPASSAAGNTPPSSGSSSSNNTVLIAGVVVAGVVLIAFVGIWLFCSKKKKKQPYYVDGRPPKGKDQFYNGSAQAQWNSPNPMDHIVKLPPPPGVMGTPVGPGAGWGVPPPPPQANTSSEFSSGFSGHNQAGPSPLGGFNKGQFSYEELAAATDGFSQDNVLGQGGFGFVHKGVLRDGREVAVKSLKSGSGQGEREFQAEVEIITRVHHRHLVSLVGYCISDGQRMLVYEFVSNKTLEFHLHGKGQPVMEWEIRLRIALGSARGLAYLHEDCHPKIIHRDIKTANILLDDKYEAMVADFGLAKLSSDNFTHVSTRVMGTFGYLAPEYASSGKLTEKSDVFSFGVMLLELITGKRPVDPTNKFVEDSLVDWARPVLAKALEDGDYREIADPGLEGNYVAHEMAQMIACAAASIRHSARRRPKMSQIVRTLEGDLSLEDLNGVATKQRQSTNFGSVGGSSVETQTYDTGMYNADMTKFRKMIMNSQEFNSSEFGATSDYGLNPSSSSSDSREYDGTTEHQKPKV